VSVNITCRSHLCSVHLIHEREKNNFLWFW
jgi:hypothetical protein